MHLADYFNLIDAADCTQSDIQQNSYIKVLRHLLGYYSPLEERGFQQKFFQFAAVDTRSYEGDASTATYIVIHAMMQAALSAAITRPMLGTPLDAYLPVELTPDEAQFRFYRYILAGHLLALDKNSDTFLKNLMEEVGNPFAPTNDPLWERFAKMIGFPQEMQHD